MFIQNPLAPHQCNTNSKEQAKTVWYRLVMDKEINETDHLDTNIQ